MDSFHNAVFVSLPPDNTKFTLLYTLHSSASNITLHPASQKFLVDINDACANSGTICASVMWFGSHGMSKLHV